MRNCGVVWGGMEFTAMRKTMVFAVVCGMIGVAGAMVSPGAALGRAGKVTFCGKTWSLGTKNLSCRKSSVRDLRPLSKLTKLKGLDLRDTKVTDLTPLGKLRKLERLDLTDTKVSKSQVAALKKALPKLRIVR